MASLELAFAEALECDLCRDMLRVPIRLCQTGHSICKTCFNIGGNCKICNSAKLQSRALVLEKILERCWVPCRNSECGYVDLGSKIDAHEAECLVPIIECPLHSIGACEWIGGLNKVEEHYRANHHVFTTNIREQYIRYFTDILAENAETLHCCLFKIGDKLLSFIFEPDRKIKKVRWVKSHHEPVTGFHSYHYRIRSDSFKKLINHILASVIELVANQS